MSTNEWRITRVEQKAVTWRLFSPFWSGFITLTTKQLFSKRAVDKQAMLQAARCTPYSTRKEWDHLRHELVQKADILHVCEPDFSLPRKKYRPHPLGPEIASEVRNGTSTADIAKKLNVKARDVERIIAILLAPTAPAPSQSPGPGPRP